MNRYLLNLAAPGAALAAAMGVCAAGAGAEPSNVNKAAKHAWGENCGWLDWRSAGSPAGASGARIVGTFCSGFVWGENIGWINLGDGTPTNGASYANTGGLGFGVNIGPGGQLSGLAWGENVGWINFALPAPLAAQQARWDAAAQRLRGYAWGENIGWINLDDTTSFVSTACPADYNLNGVVSVQDIFDFLAGYFGGDMRADFDSSGAIGVQDIFDFLSAYFSGC